MGIGLVNESFISKEASEAHKVCLQSLMTVQHQLKVYIELICQFLCQLSKKSGARDRVQPPLAKHRNTPKYFDLWSNSLVFRPPLKWE